LHERPDRAYLVENNRAAGVVVEGGEVVRAKAVVAACHVLTTFNRLLAPGDAPPELLRRLQNVNVGNGFGMTVRCASSELPDYGGGFPTEVHHGMQLLCPSEEFLRDAYADYFSGHPSRKPPVLAMTFSPIDEHACPARQARFVALVAVFPLQTPRRPDWDDAKDEAADSILETLYGYAPNLRGKIEQQYAQSPLDLERTLGLIHGNVMHVEMSLDQMFCFRPCRSWQTIPAPFPACFCAARPRTPVAACSARRASMRPAWSPAACVNPFGVGFCPADPVRASARARVEALPAPAGRSIMKTAGGRRKQMKKTATWTRTAAFFTATAAAVTLLAAGAALPSAARAQQQAAPPSGAAQKRVSLDVDGKNVKDVLLDLFRQAAVHDYTIAEDATGPITLRLSDRPSKMRLPSSRVRPSRC
jgi:hypothetical protein